MNKNEKSQYLLSMVGEIDDSILNEAASYKRRRKKTFLIPVLAACLSAIMILVMALPLAVIFTVGDLLPGDVNSPNLEGNETQGSVGDENLENDLDAVVKPYGKLDLLLNEQKNEGKYQKLDSAEELSYAGSASLVWQYEEGGEIYVLELSHVQLASVQSCVGNGTQVGADSPTLSVSVWVLDGQGNVSTPYLKASRGNVGCEIFDYEAEIIPDDELVDCISDILK